VRVSAAEEAKKTCPVLEDLRERLNDTETAFQQLVSEVQGLREQLAGEKSLLDWALAITPIALIFLFATVALFFHLKQRITHAKTRRLVREVAKEVYSRIDKLSAACFMSTPPPSNLAVTRQGHRTDEVIDVWDTVASHCGLVSGPARPHLQHWDEPQWRSASGDGWRRWEAALLSTTHSRLQRQFQPLSTPAGGSGSPPASG
jgi:hypothetical protein